MDDGRPLQLIGGVEQRSIVLVAHDVAWADRFFAERRRVATALGPAVRIEHVGSTAILGLVAKPIIDIQVSVADAAHEASYVPALEAAGYVLRVRQQAHRMLRTPSLDVHVHVCTVAGDWERRHLLLRDWLRADALDRDRYGAVKRRLASIEWPDMNAYADAKSDVIAEITSRAETWATATGWRP